MEWLKTFGAGLLAITAICYVLFLLGAVAYTMIYGFDWYTAVAIPGWLYLGVCAILAFGSIVRRKPDHSDYY